MNNIYTHDFGSLKSESLRIDYIRWNLVSLTPDQIYKSASYFKTLGFNSYQKDRDSSKSRQEIKFDRRNLHEVVFILKTNYQEGTHIEFSGASADRIFYFIKQERLKWQKLLQHKAVLRRIDVCYDRPQKSTDQISNSRFINESLQQFQESHPKQNLSFFKNQEGLVIKFGNRQSNRHYRVYNKKNILRFEFELKDKNKLNDYHILLQQSHFEELERVLSHQFFKYSFEIFNMAHQPDHLDWLFHRLRPYQFRDNLALQKEPFYIHYIRQFHFQQFQQKKDLVTLVQLLMFVRNLDYQEVTLTSKFRRFQFPVRDFLNYIHPGCSTHHYQIKQLIEFFDTLTKNTIIQSFTDEHYKMLVTIPEVDVYKSKEAKNSWVVTVWIADALFDYLCPFLYQDLFREDLTNHQFAVWFEIIKVFSSNTTRKQFNISQFLEDYDSNINGKRKKQVKDSFIHYLKVFHKQRKIQSQVFFPLLNPYSNPKSTCYINQLTSQHLSQPFVIFEIVNVKFK